MTPESRLPTLEISFYYFWLLLFLYAIKNRNQLNMPVFWTTYVDVQNLGISAKVANLPDKSYTISL